MSFDGPRWLSFAFPDSRAAGVREVKLKAYGFASLYADGECGDPVWLELVDIMHALVSREVAAKMRLHKAVGKLKDKFSIVAESLGSSFDDCVLRSRQAWPPDQEFHPCVRQEWQISSTGVWSFLLYWFHHRHVEAERAQAKSFAVAYMDTLLSEVALAMLSIGKATSATIALCPCVPSRVPGVCCHVADLLELETGLGGSVGCVVWSALDFMYLREKVCLSISSWLGSCLHLLASSINEGLEDSDKTDALKHASLRQTSKGKKRRIDEDYVAAVQAGVSAGRAGNSSILVRALGDVGSSVASEWDEKHLRTYAAQGHLSFRGCEVVGLTYDAARLGQPPEETIMFCLERVDTRETMWLPPQVFSLGGAMILNRCVFRKVVCLAGRQKSDGMFPV